MLLQRLLGGERVFEDVVQQADGDRGLVEPHVGQDVGDVERMDQVGLARAAHLPAMLARGKDVRLLQQLLVEVGLVTLDLVEDVLEADHGCFRCNRDVIVTVPYSDAPSTAPAAFGGSPPPSRPSLITSSSTLPSP